MTKEKQERFLLGQLAGDLFVEDINILLTLFKKNHEKNEINFGDESFVEGFMEAFVDGFDN